MGELHVMHTCTSKDQAIKSAVSISMSVWPDTRILFVLQKYTKNNNLEVFGVAYSSIVK